MEPEEEKRKRRNAKLKSEAREIKDYWSYIEQNKYRAVLDDNHQDIILVHAHTWRQARSAVAEMLDIEDPNRITRARLDFINEVNRELGSSVSAQMLVDEIYNNEIEEGELVIEGETDVA